MYIYNNINNTDNKYDDGAGSGVSDETSID